MVVLASGCDQYAPDPPVAHGPALTVLATHPAAGAGTECAIDSPPDCGVERDTALEFRFDRFLMPETAIRQSVKIYTTSEDLGVFVHPEYDVVERVVKFRLPAGEWLGEGVLYTVELPSPSEPDDFGFRAFDGAPLGEGSVPTTFDFRTRKTEPPANPPPEPVIPTCQDLLDAFAGTSGGCATSNCHVHDDPTQSDGCAAGQNASASGKGCVPIPRMGLDLGSPQGILATAVGHVAHQTETGAKTGVTLENPVRFGVAMPIVDPGRPDNSYLLYKLLRNPRNFAQGGGCTSAHAVPLPEGVCPEPTADESTRLADWFVLGEPMPWNENGANAYALDPRPVQAWIRAGAHCP